MASVDQTAFERRRPRRSPRTPTPREALTVDERRQLAALRARLGKAAHQLLGCGRSTLEAAIDGGQVTCESAATLRARMAGGTT